MSDIENPKELKKSAPPTQHPVLFGEIICSHIK
jgi:hypothetical protein